MSRLVSVYRLADGRLLIDTSIGYTNVWRSDGAPRVLPADTDPGRLGGAVADALLRSHEVEVAAPRDQRGDSGLLAAAGARTWARFVKGTRSVQVYDLRMGAPDDGTHIAPTRNLGARGGFEALVDENVILTTPTPSELGAAVARALELATA
jgi:hypothetical protein